MRVMFVKVLAVLGLCATGWMGARAADAPQPIVTTSARGMGLNVALTIDGYSFRRPGQPGPANAKSLPTAFRASIAVTNLSRKDVGFQFASDSAKFTARVYDSAGTLAWQSAQGTSTTGASDTSVEAVLKSGKRWAGNLTIPLVAGGKPLLPGEYSLEVTLGTSSVGASTRFEVTGPEAPEQRSGIDGSVAYDETFTVSSTENPGAVSRTESSRPLAGAEITVTSATFMATFNGTPEFNMPPQVTVWTGHSGADGKFHVTLPTGYYTISAAAPANLPISSSSATVIKTVYVPRESKVAVPLSFTANYFDGVLQQSRIAGTVWVVGATGKVLVPFAQIAIDQIVSPTLGSTFSFHWRGRTSSSGQFNVMTPPGNYRVTATVPPNGTANAGKSTTIELFVPEGVPSQAEIVIEPTAMAAGATAQVP